MLKRLSYVALSLLLVFAALTYFFSGLIIQGPPRRDVASAFAKMQEDWNINRDSMLQLMPPPRELLFPAGRAQDSLAAWFFPAAAGQKPGCALVMAHGFTDNRSGMLKYAAPYHACGCALLMFDHRAHNLSHTDNRVYGGWVEAEDVLAAHRWLRNETQLPNNQLAWVGESWGAAAVLLAAGRQDSIRPAFVAADSPFSDWYTAVGERAVKGYGGWIRWLLPATFRWVNLRLGIDYRRASPVLAAQHIQVPVFLLHSAADVETTPDQSSKIFANLAHPERSELHLTPWGTWHAQAAARRPAEYRQLLESFLYKFAPQFCPTPHPAQ